MELPDPDTIMSRKVTADTLTCAGFPTSSATLQTMATRGGGPPFSKFGPKTVLYRWGDALEWARARLTPARRSTSEADAREAA